MLRDACRLGVWASIAHREALVVPSLRPVPPRLQEHCCPVDEKGQPAKLHLDFDDNMFTVAETGQVASRLHRAARPSLSLPALHTLPSSHPAFTPCNPAFPVMQLWAAIPSTTSTKFEVHV